MPTIYKYIPEQYVASFLRGELLFRSLSYFRDYEEQQVRGDRYEGTLLHRRDEGITLTKEGSPVGETLDASLESVAKTDDIFVLCLSAKLSPQLAEEFGTTACIEIHNPALLFAGIRSALKRRSAVKNKTLLHAPVTYYAADSDMGIHWAFPDRITLMKTMDYEMQKEYRIAFGVNGALAFQNTTMRIVLPHHIPTRSLEHTEMLLKVGDLRRACTVHRFPA